MTAIWAPLVLLLAATALLSAKSVRRARGVVLASWFALAAGFAFLVVATPGLAAAVAVSAIGGLVVVQNPSNDLARRMRMTAFSIVVPISMAVLAIICVRDAVSQWGGQLALFAAAGAALVAALSCLLVSMSVSRRPLSSSIGITLAGAATAVLIAGTGRSSLLDAFYGFPLRAGDEPLRWVLGPTQRFDMGIQLAVAVPVPTIEYVLLAIMALGVLAAVLSIAGRYKAAAGSLALSLLGAGGSLIGLQSIVASLKMPPSDPYADEVKRMLLARGGGRVAEPGAFSGASDVTVAMADIAPEVFGFTLIALLAFVAVLAWKRDPETNEDQVDGGFARDSRALGIAFLWVSWFVLMIIHQGFIGSPGLGSPGEWVFTGVVLMSTGLLAATWEGSQNRLLQVIEDLAPGLIAAAIIVMAGLAWRFGALPGLSLGLF